MNILIFSAVSAVLATVLSLIYHKIRKKNIETYEILKDGVIGFLLGGINYLLVSNLGENLKKTITEFDTGSPDF
jgi:hypothetical protein